MINILRFIVDQFALGRSDFRIYAFLIYLIIIILFTLIKFKPKIDFITLRKVFIGIIILTFAINLFSFVSLVEKFDLDYTEIYNVAHDGRPSHSSLIHIHTGKGFIAKTVNLLNPDSHKTYDAGLFYAEYLSSWFWIYSAIVLPLFFFLGLLVLKKIQKEKLGYKILYTIALFSVLKNTVDGGMFEIEAVFYTSVLIALLYKDKRKIFFKIFVPWFIVLIPLHYHLFELGTTITYTLGYISFVAFILFTAKYRKNYKAVIIIILSFILIFVSLNATGDYIRHPFDLYNAGSIDVSQNSTIYYYDISNMHCNSIYKQNDFKVCKIITNENTTLGEIQKKHKTLSLLYKPIYIQNLNCNAIKYNKIHGNFILVNGTVPKIIQNTLVNLTITGNNNEYTYNGEIWDCLPNEHVSIPRIFNKHGIKSFILK